MTPKSIAAALNRQGEMRIVCFFLLTLALATSHAQAQTGMSAGVYGDIIERTISVRKSRLDVSDPESAGLVALGMEPFVTALVVVPPDFSMSSVVGQDERGESKLGVALDFSPYMIFAGHAPLRSYQGDRLARLFYRVQLSLAVSRAAFNDEEGLRIAPALRIVFHDRRDPRVHRGPGSLLNCLYNNSLPPPPDWEARIEDITRELSAPSMRASENASLREQLLAERARREQDLAQWASTEVSRAIHICRNESSVARYGWDATGLAGGIGPVFTGRSESPARASSTSMAAWLTGSYGFDPGSDHSAYATTWWAAHAQVLGQIMYQRGDRVEVPTSGGTTNSTHINRLTLSTRLRFGAPDASGSFEGALIHEERRGLGDQIYSRLSLGGDYRLAEGTWLTMSVGRTVARDTKNITLVRAALKWAPLN